MMQLSSNTPCAVTSSKNERPFPDADREPAHDTEQHAVLQQHVERAQTEQQATGEREERHADVVGEDLRRHRRLLVDRETEALAGRARLRDGLVLTRHETARGPGIAPRPEPAEQCRHRQAEERDGENRLAFRAPVASSRSRRTPTRSCGCSASCTRPDGRAARPLEPHDNRIAREAAAREARGRRRSRAVTLAQSANAVGTQPARPTCPRRRRAPRARPRLELARKRTGLG